MLMHVTYGSHFNVDPAFLFLSSSKNLLQLLVIAIAGLNVLKLVSGKTLFCIEFALFLRVLHAMLDIDFRFSREDFPTKAQ